MRCLGEKQAPVVRATPAPGDRPRYLQGDKRVAERSASENKNAYVALTAQAKRVQVAKDNEVQKRNITKELTEATDLASELACLLIDRVWIYPGNRVEVEYKVQDLFQRN